MQDGEILADDRQRALVAIAERFGAGAAADLRGDQGAHIGALLQSRLGDAWKLNLAAPPVDGKANDECVRYLAEWAGVARSRIRIVTGATSRRKLIEIEGMAQADLEARLSQEV